MDDSAEDDPERYMVEVSFSPGTPFLPTPDAGGAVPTLPLEPFAYVPSERLEAYFACKPAHSSKECIEHATTKYEGLAETLERYANDRSNVASPMTSPPTP